MMIGSAIRTTTGKKVIGIFVAIAMVLTMSNISAYYASAQEAMKAQEIENNNSNEQSPEAGDSTPAADDQQGTGDEGADNGKSEDKSGNSEGNQTNDPNDNTDDTNGKETTDPNEEDGSNSGENGNGGPDAPIEVTYKVIYNIGYTSVNPNELKDADGNALDLVINGKGNVGEETAVKAPTSVWYEGAEYNLDVVYNCVLEKDDEGHHNTVNFYYSEAGVDGVPAKYQATVKFTVEDLGLAEIVGNDSSVVTFKEGNKPSYQPAATATVTFPEVNITSPYHKEDGWYLNGEKVEGAKTTIPSSMIDEDIVFEYKCAKKDATHEVTADITFYVDDKSSDNKASVSLGTAWIGEDLTISGDEITKKINSAISVNGQKYTKSGYVLDKKAGMPEGESYTLNAGDDSCTMFKIKVYYYTDKIGVNDPNKGDKIPDIYQFLIEYKANHGSVSGLQKQVVTLYEGADQGDYRPSENGTAVVKLPATVADPGYTNSAELLPGEDPNDSVVNDLGWTITTQTIDENDDEQSYTYKVNGDTVELSSANKNGIVCEYTFIPAIFNYEVRCVDSADASKLLDNIKGEARFGSSVPVKTFVKDVIEQSEYAHYLLATDTDNNSAITIEVPNGENNSFDAYYDIDAVGENLDPFTPDGIADKNQVRVNFEAVNGTMTGATTQFVTLVNGVGTLHGPLPTYAPYEGYEAPTWTPSVPTDNTQITGDTTFVITYKAEQPEYDPGQTDNPVDEEGDNNTGNTDNAADVEGVIPAPDAPAPDAPEPADPTDEAAEPETDEGTTIPDEENPLAGNVNLVDQPELVTTEATSSPIAWTAGIVGAVILGVAVVALAGTTAGAAGVAGAAGAAATAASVADKSRTAAFARRKKN